MKELTAQAFRENQDKIKAQAVNKLQLTLLTQQKGVKTPLSTVDYPVDQDMIDRIKQLKPTDVVRVLYQMPDRSKEMIGKVTRYVGSGFYVENKPNPVGGELFISWQNLKEIFKIEEYPEFTYEN